MELLSKANMDVDAFLIEAKTFFTKIATMNGMAEVKLALQKLDQRIVEL